MLLSLALAHFNAVSKMLYSMSYILVKLPKNVVPGKGINFILMNHRAKKKYFVTHIVKKRIKFQLSEGQILLLRVLKFSALSDEG